MSSDTTEQRATNFLKNKLLISELIIPHISENDKTPSFDGELILYSSNNHEKSNIRGYIPIQVKGKTVNTFQNPFSYSVSYVDLHNFYKKQGCLFIVVQLLKSDATQFRICYKSLTLLDLRNLIEKNSDSSKRKKIRFS